jgi:hypothetical protein
MTVTQLAASMVDVDSSRGGGWGRSSWRTGSGLEFAQNLGDSTDDRTLFIVQLLAERACDRGHAMIAFVVQRASASAEIFTTTRRLSCSSGANVTSPGHAGG